MHKAKELYSSNQGHRLYRNHQYCLSTGNDKLDQIINGYVVGSIVTIITSDDAPSEYHLQLLRLSAGEAIVNDQHAIIYDSYSQRRKKFWADLLPKANKKSLKKKAEEYKTGESKNLKYGEVLKNMKEGASDNLLLAWRYNECIQTQQDLRTKQEEGSHLASDFRNRKCDYQFDLSHTMTDMISGHNIPINKDKYFNVVEEQFLSLNELWESICVQYQDKLESADDESFFRIFLPNFLNLDLYEETSDLEKEYSCKNVIKFLRSLRTLANTMNSVITITIDKESLKSNALLSYFIKFSDLVLDLKSFSDSQDEFLDYQGSIRILKQPAINGLVGHKADQDIYVFKSDKKNFKIETIHMDPEVDTKKDNTTKEEDGQSSGTTSVLCSSKPSNKDPLDF
ncbi:unnamed protein product [Moneuplotes crassus]|uniref:Elongator complex protein 4 n=1 Tax=Euplotes crassus TaxID=5936 RepID=A0AAD1XG73_EUPCR|nr:unnamed protein product [Moneuplotes crassus]